MPSRNISIILIFIIIAFAGGAYIYNTSGGLPVNFDLPKNTSLDESNVPNNPEENQNDIEEENNDETKVSFEESGYITSGNPGQEEGKLYIVYEEPGSPGLSKELTFDVESTCNSNGVDTPCIALSQQIDVLFEGRLVNVSGFVAGDSILVRNISSI